MTDYVNEVFSDKDSIISQKEYSDTPPNHVRHFSDGDTGKRYGSFRSIIKQKSSSFEEGQLSTSTAVPMSPGHRANEMPEISQVSFNSSLDKSGISDLTKYTTFYASSLDTTSTLSDQADYGPQKRISRYIHPFGHSPSIIEALQRQLNDEEPAEFIKQVLKPSPIKQLVWIAFTCFMLLIALAIILAAESSYKGIDVAMTE